MPFIPLGKAKLRLSPSHIGDLRQSAFLICTGSALRRPGVFSIISSFITLFCILSLLLLSACGAKKGNLRNEDDELSMIVAEIEFSGVKRFEKKQILEYMNTRENSWWDWTIFVDTSHYNESYLRRDLRRIEDLYRSYGFFQARVVEQRFEVIDEKKRTGRVLIEIDEGTATLVKSVVFEWPEGQAYRCEIESASLIREGEVFETEKLNKSVDEMNLILQERAYALARIEEFAEINENDRSASVVFRIMPGPYCRIGDIRYEGLRMATKRLLDVEVEFARDEAYRPALIRRIEQVVYAMDVFDSVSVQHDSELDGNGKLGLTVSVVESKSQSIKAGPGLGFEPNRWEARASMLYTHLNPFGDLTRLDLRLMAGYAVLPYPWQPEEHGPVFKLMPALRKKGWLEPHLVWTIRPSFELGVEEGYQYYTPRLRLGVSRFLFGFTLIEASYNFHFFDFFDSSKIFTKNGTLLGRDFADPYILSYIELSYTIFLSDDFFNPRNGVVFKLSFDSAGTIVGGYYDYLKLTPEIRGYWKVFSHLQFAGRLRSGYLWPYAWRPGTPISEKFYLGGSDTIRGWGLRRLSPQIVECDTDGSDCRSLPIGGKTMLLGNLELRFMVIRQFYLVPFFDMGDVQAGEMKYVPSEWSFSTGGGLRYDSPIGKFRLDFGWRLNEQKRFNDERRWGLHFSLGETF